VAESSKVFLTARWEELLMLNYEVDPNLLAAYVPAGTYLDSFQNKTYLSLVAFRFLETKLFGIASIPFHRDFLEINLRFYVRRTTDSEERRGVVFLAEIVPKRMIALVAHTVYGENYLFRRMSSVGGSEFEDRTLKYGWRSKDSWCRLAAKGSESASYPSPGSLEQFITAHYWGYSAQSNGGSLEYQVVHPAWKVTTCTEAAFAGNPTPEYGPEFARVLTGRPSSAFIADGSAVTVCKGQGLHAKSAKVSRS
jgi:uncharacterized protein YqjF (DUF2071 family)